MSGMDRWSGWSLAQHCFDVPLATRAKGSSRFFLPEEDSIALTAPRRRRRADSFWQRVARK